MRYIGNPSSEPIRAKMRAGVIDMIATPAQRMRIPDGAAWCADNGCFGSGYPGDELWLAWLGRFTPDEISRCMFATAPDVVGDAAATLERSAPWLPKIRALGYRAALVAQDGLEDLAVPWDDFDVLFIGGSTEWKLGPHARELVAEAKRRSKWVHMGRVNSGRRFRYAETIGCDSVDGTLFAIAVDDGLRRVLDWLGHHDTHEPLFTLTGERS